MPDSQSQQHRQLESQLLSSISPPQLVRNAVGERRRALQEAAGGTASKTVVHVGPGQHDSFGPPPATAASAGHFQGEQRRGAGKFENKNIIGIMP